MTRVLGGLSLLIYVVSIISVLLFPAADSATQQRPFSATTHRVSASGIRMADAGGAASPKGAPMPAAQGASADAGAGQEPAVSGSGGDALPQMVGMGLNLYHTEDLSLYLDAVDRIAAMGFNTVHVVTPMFQRNGASQEIQRQVGPGRALPMTDLLKLLERAKSRGLSTVLMPQVNFTHPRGNEWRGKIQPQRWDVWWEQYREMIGRHAVLAQRAEVDLFVVGCELLSTQKSVHDAQWRAVIEHVRRRFDGALSYSTNWDSYQKFALWHELDAIGISGYWDVTRAASDPNAPTDDELAARWGEIRETVLAYAEAQDRPVLITELGYPSLPWALRSPWNYVNPDGLQADHETQARGYRAFLRGWHDLLSVPSSASPGGTLVRTPQARWRLPRGDMAGVLFYRWDPYYEGGPKDTGYGVVGKPAFEILDRWLDGDGVASRP